MESKLIWRIVKITLSSRWNLLSKNEGDMSVEKLRKILIQEVTAIYKSDT